MANSIPNTQKATIILSNIVPNWYFHWVLSFEIITINWHNNNKSAVGEMRLFEPIRNICTSLWLENNDYSGPRLDSVVHAFASDASVYTVHHCTAFGSEQSEYIVWHLWNAISATEFIRLRVVVKLLRIIINNSLAVVCTGTHTHLSNSALQLFVIKG